MSPEAAEQFLARRINYERAASMPSSEAAYKLDRMRELLHRLDDPQQNLPIVHIAGTKGKGSTAAMIAAILTAAGHRVGRFTSPHLNRVEERLAIDGRACEPNELADVLERLQPIVETMDQQGATWSPTYFEILTAAALSWFAKRRVDWAVLEVGLGGRLDSTNVCRPRLSIVTSISLDHTRQLGATTAAIAAEKAGIIKPSVPVLSGVREPEPREVIRRVARQNGCRLLELGEDFTFDYRPPRHLERAPSPGFLDFRGHLWGDDTSYQDLPLKLPGRHQAANAALALAAVEILRHEGVAISASAVRHGLGEATCPARVEVVGRRPVVVLDAAHNVTSIAALIESLNESFSVARRLLIFAATQEKDLRGMLERLVEQFDHILLTRYQNNPRGVPPEQLQAILASLPMTPGVGANSQNTPTVEIAPTPADAWAAIHRLARPDDLVCITGSFVLAGQMRRCIADRPLS